MAVDELVIKWSMDSKKFDEGLSNMNRSMNLLKSEFGATSSKLQQFGSETDKLKNKQDYLNNAIEIQKAKVDTLKKAYDKQVEATGENSKEAENLAIKLNNQVKYYNNLQRELEETNKELNIQNSAWNKVSKGLDNAANKIKGFGGKLSSLGGTLTSRVTGPLTAAFAVLTEGTKELRLDLSKLEANVKSAGKNVEETNEQFTYLAAITGEADSSIEALSNLLSAGLSETQMQQAINNLSGAIIKFPDTLKIESLADSLQETLATGEATGQYGELLERLGVNLETFNEGLQEATENGTAQQYALDALAQNGLSNLNEEYRINNKELIENARAQEELKIKTAELGEKLAPLLTTLTEFATKALGAFTSLDKETQDKLIKVAIAVAALGPLITVIGTVIKIIGSVVTIFSTVSGAIAVVTTGVEAATPAIATLASAIGVLTSPITLIIAAIAAAIAVGVLLWKNWDTIKEKASQIWGNIKSKVEEHGGGIKGVIGAVGEANKVLWSKAFNAMDNVTGGSLTKIKNKITEGLNNIKSKFQEHGGGIKGIVGAVGEANKVLWSKAFNAMDNATGGSLTKLKNKISSGLNVVKGFFQRLRLPEIKIP